MGNRVHAILPRQLSSLLEEYLAEHRTTLVNGTEALTLFVNREGKKLNSNMMDIRVRTLTMRFGAVGRCPLTCFGMLSPMNG